MREVIPALINPTEELACLSLRVLFRAHQHANGPIPRLGKWSMARALAALGPRANGEHWHDRLKLRELSEDERRQLVRALAHQAPPSWKAAA